MEIRRVQNFAPFPYRTREIEGKFYVQVLTYSNQVWYPWKWKFIAKSGYPIDRIQLQYAMEFDSQWSAWDFIDGIWNNDDAALDELQPQR